MKNLTPKTLKKIAVYFILGMFLLSTVLMSAMYFVDMQSKSTETTQIDGDLEIPAIEDAAVETGA